MIFSVNSKESEWASVVAKEVQWRAGGERLIKTNCVPPSGLPSLSLTDWF